MSFAGPRRFFFVRHGETAWNREGRLQGQHDAMLNPLGRSQAGAAGGTLARLLGDRGLDPAGRAFACSPLARTRDTMELLRAGLNGSSWENPREPSSLPRETGRGSSPSEARSGDGLPAVVFDDRLKELSFGDWEGRTWEDLKRREPAAVAARRRDTWGFVPPGGESYAMLLDRLSPWLAELAEDAVVVAHGGVARALLHRAAAVATDRATAEEVHQGRVLLFEGGAAHWV